MMPIRKTDHAFVLCLVLCLIALKGGVLLVFGPIMSPDGTGYAGYADAIIAGTFTHVDLERDAIPITLARPIGYPALIAAAKILAGQSWQWAIVLLQFAASLLATTAVYRLARSFRLGVWPSLGVAAAQATAIQFVIDQAIATDSLYASALTIAQCLIAAIVLHRKAAGLIGFVGAGGLIAASFVLRDATEFLAVGFVPLAAAAVGAAGSRLRQGLAFALVFIPLILTQRTYVEWNRWRVGVPVVTTVAQFALLTPLANASRYDAAIFSGSSPLDETARRVFKAFNVDEVLEVNQFLHRDYGWDSLRIAHEVTAAYLRAWVDHPAAMIRNFMDQISESQLHQAVRPVETVRDLLLWSTGSDRDFARERAVRAGNWWMIAAVIANRALEAISVAIFAGFILITPFRLVREGWSAEVLASIGLGCAYLAFDGFYAAVRLEVRYLAPVVMGSIVVGAANLAWLVAFCRSKMEARPSIEGRA